MKKTTYRSTTLVLVMAGGGDNLGGFSTTGKGDATTKENGGESDTAAMKNQLDKLIEKIGSTYIINKTDYPVTANLSPEDTLNFSLSHSLKHMMKKVGRIAGAAVTNKEWVPENKKALYSLLISLLKMCELMEITGADIIRGLTPHRIRLISGKTLDFTHADWRRAFLELLVDMSFIADLLEENDHTGGALNHEVMKKKIAYCIDDVCTLAELSNMTLEQFFEDAAKHI